ncbi:MAG TPA: alpha/beta fold hydrolase [Pyrinomonadaceae bacterium]
MSISGVVRILLCSLSVWLIFSPVAQAQSDPRGLRPCTAEPSVQCGTFRVFEDRQKKSGRTIDLNVIVLPAVGERKFDPMFDLSGGPGAAATLDLELIMKELPQYRQGRDIVLVDQRGTGNSNPLRCEPLPGHTALDEMYPVAYVQRCRESLEKSADLTKYTTEIAIDDLDDIRRWLGYKKIDLWAISYGTRAAQVYVRQHGDAVGHVVLTGAIGTYHKMPFYHAPNAQASLDLLLTECERDERCHAAFPAIKQETGALFVRLKRGPIKAIYQDPQNGSPTSYLVRGEIFAESIRTWLYTRDTTQQIPFVIHEAALGNFSPFLKRVLRADGPDLNSFIADGMYLSVTCAEDVPYIDVADADRLSRKTIFGNYRVLQQKRACANWPKGKIGADYRRAVTSDVPVMFVTGALDPVTSPRWADELARGFRHHVMLTISEQGHGPVGLTNIDCEDSLIIRFISDLPIGEADKVCLSNMQPPPFVVNEK